jgi:hypothetical protein
MIPLVNSDLVSDLAVGCRTKMEVRFRRNPVVRMTSFRKKKSTRLEMGKRERKNGKNALAKYF